jgi:hypothetical protein
MNIIVCATVCVESLSQFTPNFTRPRSSLAHARVCAYTSMHACVPYFNFNVVQSCSVLVVKIKK